jgi:hypothetical protein
MCSSARFLPYGSIVRAFSVYDPSPASFEAYLEALCEERVRVDGVDSVALSLSSGSRLGCGTLDGRILVLRVP